MLCRTRGNKWRSLFIPLRYLESWCRHVHIAYWPESLLLSWIVRDVWVDLWRQLSNWYRSFLGSKFRGQASFQSDFWGRPIQTPHSRTNSVTPVVYGRITFRGGGKFNLNFWDEASFKELYKENLKQEFDANDDGLKILHSEPYKRPHIMENHFM